MATPVEESGPQIEMHFSETSETITDFDQATYGPMNGEGSTRRFPRKNERIERSDQVNNDHHNEVPSNFQLSEQHEVASSPQTVANNPTNEAASTKPSSKIPKTSFSASSLDVKTGNEG